jgi:hypothetical protein
VGRNELENNVLDGFARHGWTRLEVEAISGPVTLVMGCAEDVEVAAKLTVRYSDAPIGEPAWVGVRFGDRESRIHVEAIDEDELEVLKIRSHQGKREK